MACNSCNQSLFSRTYFRRIQIKLHARTLFSLLVEPQSVFFGAGMELNTDPRGDKVDTYFCAPPKAPINAKDLLLNSLIFLFICKIKLTNQLWSITVNLYPSRYKRHLRKCLLYQSFTYRLNTKYAHNLNDFWWKK